MGMRLAVVLSTLVSVSLARDAKQLSAPLGYAGYPYHGLGLAGGYGTPALPYYAGYAANQYQFGGFPYTGYPYTGLPYAGYPYTLAAPPQVETEESEVPAVSYAYPNTPAIPYAPVAPVAPAPYSAGTQYHAQDEFGNLNYGYSNVNSVKHEVGNTYGGVTGEYSYVDANGKLQKVQYIADAGGFRVADSRLPTFNPEPLTAPTFDADLPIAPADTPEAAVAAEAALIAETAEADTPAERRKREAQFSYGVTTYHPATGYKYPYGLPSPTVAAPADETDTEEAEMPAVAYAPTPAFPYTHGLPYAGYGGLPYYPGYGLGAGYGLNGLGYGLPY